MPRYNVQNPKTKEWACFSTVVDDYITPFMPEDEFKVWRSLEYGRQADRTPLEMTNQLLFVTAEKRIKEREKYDKRRSRPLPEE